jgi:hypothetical protein
MSKINREVMSVSFRLKVLGEIELKPGDYIRVLRNLESKFEYITPADTKAKLKIMVIEKYE